MKAKRPERITDGELLDEFVRRQNSAAFEALLARHGAMVLSVCRRVLPDPTSADDAFQATFMVLLKKAATLREADLLGNWLYGVAYRTAARARVDAAKRRVRESEALARESSDPLTELTARELMAAIDEELIKLPQRYRAPLVACYLEGKTRDEAAAELGWSLSTLGRRLCRGRDLLRARFTGRDLALPIALLAAALSGSAFAAFSSRLSAPILKAIARARIIARVKLGAKVVLATLFVGGVGGLTNRTLPARMLSSARDYCLPSDSPAEPAKNANQSDVAGPANDAAERVNKKKSERVADLLLSPTRAIEGRMAM